MARRYRYDDYGYYSSDPRGNDRMKAFLIPTHSNSSMPWSDCSRWRRGACYTMDVFPRPGGCDHNTSELVEWGEWAPPNRSRSVQIRSMSRDRGGRRPLALPVELACQPPVGALVPKLTQTQLESTFLWAEPCDCLTKQGAHGDYHGTLLTVLKINRVRGDGRSCGGFRSLKALSS
jgi:hypothetical protein